jgi:hypothetical protein
MNTRSFRRYSLALSAMAVIPFVAIIATALLLLPMRNDSVLVDLVRVGSYSLNRYAHEKPQLSFEPPMFEVGRYDRYADIVILGDSFSYDKQHSWVNFVAARGWSVVVLPLLPEDQSVEHLLAQPAFRNTPPKLVIYESIERNLKDRFGPPRHTCAGPGIAARSQRIDLPLGRHREFTLVPSLEPRDHRLDAQQIAYARDFLVDNVGLWLRPQRRRVYDFALTVPRFSNVASRRIIVLMEDTEKSRWTSADLATMRCTLARYAGEVEANGRTVFMALLAPDKLSAYHADLADQTPATSVIPVLVGATPVMPRLDLALRRAIEAGELDVYTPSDSHWGAAGHRIAADVVLDAIEALARPSAMRKGGLHRKSRRRDRRRHPFHLP